MVVSEDNLTNMFNIDPHLTRYVIYMLGMDMETLYNKYRDVFKGYDRPIPPAFEIKLKVFYTHFMGKNDIHFEYIGKMYICYSDEDTLQYKLVFNCNTKTFEIMKMELK